MLVARSPHHVDYLTYRICRTLRIEIDLLSSLLADISIPVATPIAHLVEREPTFVSYGDASLINGGGWSLSLDFWWYIAWPDDIVARTIKHLKNNDDGTLLSINILEYAVVIVDLSASLAAYAILDSHPDPYPTLLNRCDNMSADKWSTHGSTQSPAGKSLSQLLCYLLIDSPMGMNSKWIGTKENLIADDISRINTDSNLEYDFSLLQQKHPQLQTCRFFRPSAKLLS